MNPLNTPEKVVELVNTDFFLHMHRGIMFKALLHSAKNHIHRNSVSTEDANTSIDAFEEASGIRLSYALFTSILCLYPISESIIFDDPGATDAREEVLNMMANFFLNSWWPGSGDNLLHEADGFENFLEALKKSYEYMVSIF